MPRPYRIALAVLVLFSMGLVAPAFAQNPNCKGIWISPEECLAIPQSGSAWSSLKSKADSAAGTPNISNQEDPVNVQILAKALVYACTGTEKYRTEVIAACMAAIGTEKLGRTLALGRELIAYVIAADLVGLPPTQDQIFKNWLRVCLTESLEGKTLISTHEVRPNNWGTHAGGSRVAVAVYLGDAAELDRCSKVFKGWLGDRATYAKFTYGEMAWQADTSKPVGVNIKGAMIAGHSVDGVLPDDERRAGAFSWPPTKENYVYEALQGALAQAVILHRQGYDVWNWQDRALLRSFDWLHTVANFPASGDDTWEPHLMNYYYARSFSAPVPTTPGKNVGYTDWTHGSGSISNLKTGVHGKVENSALGVPISGAEVQLMAGGQVKYTTHSNGNGFYRFINPSAGTYDLLCSSPGCANWKTSVIVPVGQQLFGKNIGLVAGANDAVPPAAPTNLREVKTTG